MIYQKLLKKNKIKPITQISNNKNLIHMGNNIKIINFNKKIWVYYKLNIKQNL